VRIYWAQVQDNIVVQTSVSESADFGAEWFGSNLGGVWVEYWREGGERKNPAGIGHTYDADRDAFIPPQRYASWVLDEDTCLWVAPIAYPAEGMHTWDEEAGDWVEVPEAEVE